MTETAVRYRVPQWTIGERLRKARMDAGMEQAELAYELGVSRRTVVNYEHDAVAQRRHVVMAWALRTGVPVWWLEGAEEPRSDDPIGARQGLPRQDLNLRPSD